MMPSNNENEMAKVKMYAVVDGEYREVIELQGEITLSECDEQLWQYDYVRVVRCKECRYWEEQAPVAGICCGWRGTMDDDYCSYGERRSEDD